MTNSLDTNLNQYPYYADFSVNSQYYAELIKPGATVQTRELTNMQLQGQAQIGMFANNIFVAGTIVSGCNLNYDNNLQYVKVLDDYANGTALSVTSLIGNILVSNTGLKAYIRNAISGYVAQSPNLNTFYLKYLNSATSNSLIQVFQNDEILTVYNSSNVALGTIQVANTISSGNSNTTGYAYGMSVGSGVIYQKGYFLTVSPQNIVVDPYDNYPDGVSVGFQSQESIVTALTDQSLFDNAQGAPNYNAPGADRLKIVPSLVVVNTSSISTNTFFSIVNFVQGSPSIINGNTTYSTIGEAIASVSSDTNGNFIITPYNIKTLQLYTTPGNTSTLDPNNIRVEIGSGISYIDGTKIQIVGKALSVIPKGTAINYANGEILTTQYGNYINVQDIGGIFDATQLQKLSLRNANAYASSNNLQKGVSINAMSPPGSEIGTAYLYGTNYVSGTPDQQTYQQSFFLGNITMENNNSFASVKSIFANNSNILGFADVIGGGNSTLSGGNFACLVYPFAQQAIKALKTSSNTTDTEFQYLQSTSVTFNTSGVASITLPTVSGGTNQLPFGVGFLTTQQIESEFYVVAEGNCHSANINGSVANANSTFLTGSSTLFQTQLSVGTLITIANSTASAIAEVANIVSNTSLGLTNPLASSWTAANINIAYLNGQNIPVGQLGSNIHITNTTNFTINLNQNLNATLAANVWYPIQRSSALPLRKTLQTDVWIKINCSNAVGGVTGPWCLGIPDVFSLNHVYVGTTYSNTNPDMTNNFTLNNGQGDLFYGLGYISSNGITLTTSDVLLIQIEAFKQDFSTGEGFFSIASYPVDDTGKTANSIFTQDIPIYYSAALQGPVNLRSSVDFRPYLSNTIPYCNSSLAVANTLILNPANTFTLVTTNLMMPIVDAEFVSSLQYYMGRYDQIGLTNSGVIVVNSGIPSLNPYPPSPIQSGITLALVNVPPYPSLTPDNSDIPSGYPMVSLTYNQLKRYTMEDIGNLDAQIQQLQYYSALSLLESSTQNLLLTNESGQTAFQTGILVDPMQNYLVANTLAPGFNITMVPSIPEARPVFSSYFVNLNFNPYSNDNVIESTDANGDITGLITLNYNEAVLISQPFACGVQTPPPIANTPVANTPVANTPIANTPPAQNTGQGQIYTWSGTLLLYPEGNTQAGPTVEPITGLPAYETITYYDYGNVLASANVPVGTNPDTELTTLGLSLLNGAADGPVTQSLVTNFTVSNPIAPTPSYITEYMYTSPDVVTCTAYGMKPSTQVWCFVDDQLMTVNDVPITQNSYPSGFVYQTADPPDLDNPQVGVLMTSDKGTLLAQLHLPAGTFYFGTNLNVCFCDTDNISAIGNVTTIATATYFECNTGAGGQQ